MKIYPTILVLLFALAGCAVAEQPTPSSEPTASVPPSGDDDGVAGEVLVKGPSSVFRYGDPGVMPSWGNVDQTKCTSANFTKTVAPDNTVLVKDNTTQKTWAAPEAYANGRTIADACTARFAGSRPATLAEIQTLTTAVAGCPLPADFVNVELFHMATSDGRCIDLKTGQTLTDAVCAADGNGSAALRTQTALCIHD